jgi:hypothetical protein
MESKMTAFPLDTDDKSRSLLAGASEFIQARYSRHQMRAEQVLGLARQRNSSLMDSQKDLQRVKNARAHFAVDLQRFARSEFVTNAAGEKELHPELKKFDLQIAMIEKKIADLNSISTGTSYFNGIESLLHAWPVNRPLEQDHIPAIDITDVAGLKKAAAHEKKQLAAMIAEYDSIFLLPVDQATAFQRIDDFIAQARAGIDAGGLFRGYSTDHQSKRSLRVLNPSPAIPKLNLGFGENLMIQGDNALGVLAWLQPDAIRAKLREQYKFTKSMSPAEKPGVIDKLQKSIWRLRVKIEATICAIEDAGESCARPSQQPAEILLGIMPLIGFAPDACEF